ncbi:cation:proton antiporter [Acuticoccus sp. M5D2P5]|uniref:cation:proton antiporter domain-containing protein n=1 Tax=Acuticoccus kalidii TaxID=2910977 RepID=UPI001F38FA20|nr:cation:proton antiporter [Acuticoccus kalidii]MCF3933816.1 cation:proton antiporter [Acuticoccus kalidii]
MQISEIEVLMEHEVTHSLPYLKEALIFLVSAGVVVPILQRFGLNSILGYLVAGVVVGPYGIGSLGEAIGGVPFDMFTISDPEGVTKIAELGVVFLLFVIGIELSGPRLWAMRRLVFGLGLAQVLLTAALLAGAGVLAGLSTEAAIAIGASLALSSTAIVVQLLVGAGRLASPSGQVMFSILLMQDIAVVPVILVIESMEPHATEGLWQSLVMSTVLAAGIIATILFAGGRVIGPLFRFVGARQDRDMFTAAALLVIIGTAAITSMVGLSMALGAFLAGLVFADTEFSHQLEAEIAPFKGLLLGLFFLGVGMTIDPRVVVQDPLTLFAVIAGVIAIKAFSIILLCLLTRQPLSVALESGLMLSQIGEFSLVGLALASSTGVVPADVARILVVAAGVTMALTGIIAGPVQRLSRWLALRSTQPTVVTSLSANELEGHVIIAGFGRIGRAIGELLDQRHIRYIALDLNAHAVARARSAGQPVFFGDTRRLDVLHNAGAHRARAIILTMDNPAANAAVVRSLRHHEIATPVVARARDRANASELYALGANEVVLEAFEASLQIGEETLVTLGYPRDAAHAVIGEQREIGRRELTDAVRSIGRTS